MQVNKNGRATEKVYPKEASRRVYYMNGEKMMIKHAPIVYTVHNIILLLSVSLSSRHWAFLVPLPKLLAQWLMKKNRRLKTKGVYKPVSAMMYIQGGLVPSKTNFD